MAIQLVGAGFRIANSKMQTAHGTEDLRRRSSFVADLIVGMLKGGKGVVQLKRRHFTYGNSADDHSLCRDVAMDMGDGTDLTVNGIRFKTQITQDAEH